MTAKFTRSISCVILLLAFAGCARYQANLPKTDSRTNNAYYFQNHTRTNNSDEILFLLAFSGGGTRAAAFSYGLLESLRDTSYPVAGSQRRLLDEVDAISSVSGGSITAAAYGLYGDKTFEIFESAFLERDIELALLGKVMNPLHWPALWSPYYSRSDLAAKYYDKILFKHATFQNLTSNNSPYLVINGTDVDTGTRISFTQNFFDLLASDVSSYPLSRAVAASSAVPGLLTPITLNNYAGEHQKEVPAWVMHPYGPDAGLAGRQLAALRDFACGTNHPYLHLVDGGVADNLGLRVYEEGLSYLQLTPELLKAGPLKNLRKVVFVCVNAHVQNEKHWDRSAKTPGSLAVAIVADGVTMEHYSNDSLSLLRLGIERAKNFPELKDKVEFYSIDLSFDQIRETSEAEYLLSLPTSFCLRDEAVKKLKQAAHTLLYQHPEFKRLMTDLKAHPAAAPRK